MNLSNSDVYINVAGGLKIDETAVDLGVCAAIASSQADVAISPDMVFIGEVGLGGELRGVSRLSLRGRKSRETWEILTWVCKRDS